VLHQRCEEGLHGQAVSALSFSPGGKYLSVGCAEGGLFLLDIEAAQGSFLYWQRHLTIALAASQIARGPSAVCILRGRSLVEAASSKCTPRYTGVAHALLNAPRALPAPLVIHQCSGEK
jgi:hypothetical protein